MEPLTNEWGLSTTWNVGADDPISLQRSANNVNPKVATQTWRENIFMTET